MEQGSCRGMPLGGAYCCEGNGERGRRKLRRFSRHEGRRSVTHFNRLPDDFHAVSLSCGFSGVMLVPSRQFPLARLTPRARCRLARMMSSSMVESP
jgi:hypothetical protein